MLFCNMEGFQGFATSSGFGLHDLRESSRAASLVQTLSRTVSTPGKTSK